MTTIGMIGFGNMGQAIYHRLEQAFGADSLYVVDHHTDKLPKQNSGTSLDVLEPAEVVIIGVKPQSYTELAVTLNGCLANKRVISIMTGISLDQLSRTTGSKDIVRTMPNLPIKIGKGLTGWIGTQKGDWVIPILQALGQEVRVDTEDQLECITATSGSGPAYFFYLCELLAQKAEAYGFSSEQSRRIAEATFVGSAALLDSEDKSAEQWRQAVTSKGGTTNAAITSLQANHFGEIFQEAIDKARLRAIELKNS
ncbi:MAG: pyrroline-5-carboxylate reductase [Chlamydiales bacterium]|nr:pyrroline-5-carboxylate reductase [Chlamydiales bacterium]